jgi:1-aminocyclopropane-1-carboxylate deaminase/D-cysteine desulfhydrase-like pyridoxal-dependent ACC family enzyme
MPLIQPERLEILDAPKGTEVYILRLDKMHEIISGNKWLKIQGWLETAAACNRKGIMTAGGAWSNHVHAAAAWCCLNQVPFRAVIKGRHGLLTPMLQDVLDWNGNITWVNHKRFTDENAWQLEAEASNMQWIPMGGDGAEGESGVRLFFDGFASYHFDELWCACGTGTTIAGIAASAIGAKTLVAFDPGIGDKKVHEKLMRLPQYFPNRSIQIERLPFDKFGKTSDVIIESMNRFWEATGVSTDVLYTGKMIHHLFSKWNKPTICEKKSILFVHTGGLQGNRSLMAGRLKFMG